MGNTAKKTTGWLLAGIVAVTTGLHGEARGRQQRPETIHSTFTINAKGYIVSIYDKQQKQNYSPQTQPSALLNLEKDGKWISPVSAKFSPISTNRKWGTDPY